MAPPAQRMVDRSTRCISAQTDRTAARKNRAEAVSEVVSRPWASMVGLKAKRARETRAPESPKICSAHEKISKPKIRLSPTIMTRPEKKHAIGVVAQFKKEGLGHKPDTFFSAGL